MPAPLAPGVELTLVGALLKKKITVDDLEPRTLSHTGRKIWQAAKSLQDQGGTYDDTGVKLAAVEVFGLAKDRLLDYLAAVAKAETTNAADIYGLLRKRNALIQVANEVQGQLASGNLDLDKIGGYVSAVVGAKTDLVSVEEDLAEGEPSPPSGPLLQTLPTLSGAVNGLHGLWVVAGITGVGKSTLARQIAIDSSREIPVLIYSFEDTKREILYQLCSNFGLEAARRIGKRLYIRESLRTLRKDLARVPPPAVVLVDSIQRVPVKSDDYLQGLNTWLNKFEEIKQSGYAVILCSEINRQSYTGDPRLDAFKESGRIEYAATFALVLQEADAGMVRLHIVKNRYFPNRGLLGLIDRCRPHWFREVDSGLILNA